MGKIKSCIVAILLIFWVNSSFSQSSIEHVVKSGESLSKISMKYDISVNDIKEFNGLISDMIFVNQTINIPNKEPYIKPEIGDLESLNVYDRICVRGIYHDQIGVRELTGTNDGFHVEMFLESTGLGKGYPWCAAFIHWSYFQCGIVLDLKYPAWVPSYFPNDKLIMVRGKFQLRKPMFGDLIGIWFPKKERLAHVGFYDGENSKYYFTVEGNTNEAGSREGDGVYRKRRIKRQVHSISSWINK